MYKNIITIKNDAPNEKLLPIYEIAVNAFNNRAGKLENTSKNPYILVFEGGDNYYACLEIGMFELKDNKDFMDCVQAWQWVDNNPDESCDMLKVFSMTAQ
jgi:hypothetical protein